MKRTSKEDRKLKFSFYGSISDEVLQELEISSSEDFTGYLNNCSAEIEHEIQDYIFKRLELESIASITFEEGSIEWFGIVEIILQSMATIGGAIEFIRIIKLAINRAIKHWISRGIVTGRGSGQPPELHTSVIPRSDITDTQQFHIEKDKTEVENMILGAKLDISESRFKLILYLAGGFLALFGVMLPLFLSWDSSSRVDKAIGKMENSFKELAGTQLRKPDIECYFKGEKLNNRTLSFDYDKSYDIEVTNTGDAMTTDLQFYFYISDVQENDIYLYSGWWDGIGKLSDEPTFPTSYKYRGVPYLNPKETHKLPIIFVTSDNKGNKASVLLKIYYGQPEPKKIPFNIIIKSQ